MKAILLCLFLVNIAFGQDYISLNYEKPGSQNVKNENTSFNKNVDINVISAAWQRGFINTRQVLLKAGCKFSYSSGKFFDTWWDSPEHFLDSKINIYDFELNTSLSYNYLRIKPFIGVGLGVENYRRSVEYAKGASTVSSLVPLDEDNFFISYNIGITYEFLDFMSATVQYSSCNFNYKNKYQESDDWIWGKEISNQRGNISVGLSYIF